jgi:hypothetical protein
LPAAAIEATNPSLRLEHPVSSTDKFSGQFLYSPARPPNLIHYTSTPKTVSNRPHYHGRYKCPYLLRHALHNVLSKNPDANEVASRFTTGLWQISQNFSSMTLPTDIDLPAASMTASGRIDSSSVDQMCHPYCKNKMAAKAPAFSAR